jgi:putative ABC transport system ATP-binding protein
MIRLSSLVKVFNAGEPNEVNAIRGVDLQISRGQFTVIIGPNGSGKSTLLNLISGSLFPSSGTIAIAGGEVTRLPEHRRSKWMARVFQDPLKGTAPGLSILDNFRLAALRTSPKGLRMGNSTVFRKRVAETIAPLGMGLENQLDSQMGSLSGGQRQALTLLMCTMDKLEILLLDEPTAALDPSSAKLVMKTAAELAARQNLTVILVTHHLKDAFDYGNRLIFMERGSVIRDLAGDEKKALPEMTLYGWFMDAGE